MSNGSKGKSRGVMLGAVLQQHEFCVCSGTIQSKVRRAKPDVKYRAHITRFSWIFVGISVNFARCINIVSGGADVESDNDRNLFWQILMHHNLPKSRCYFSDKCQYLH